MKSYECKKCNNETNTEDEDTETPICCGEPMKRVWCTNMQGGKNVPLK